MTFSETYQIKISFIHGLRDIVKQELLEYSDISIVEEYDDEIYIAYIPHFELLEKLKTVQRICLVQRGLKLHPKYLSSHKSILKEMVSHVLSKKDPREFKTFTIACAGADSTEVQSLVTHIQEQSTLRYVQGDADLKIQIIKPSALWEIAIQTTPIPVSLRGYKEHHITGGIRPSVAHAINRLCQLERATTYVNLCSGSATLLIEAGLAYPHLQLMGIDHDKKTNSLAIRNITKAGLIRRITIITADICDLPEYGMCDVIVADVPFGMTIGKHTDVDAVYRACISSAMTHLRAGGILALYATHHERIVRCLAESACIIEKEYPLRLMTSVGSYLTPRIYICRLPSLSTSN